LHADAQPSVKQRSIARAKASLILLAENGGRRKSANPDTAKGRRSRRKAPKL
jgi:hypothetical protein